ncbi:MAG: C1 family peptidase [Bacteroidota bacterium]
MINEGTIEKSTYIWKKQTGKFKGGHAMVVIGYNDTKNAFKVMNSWGTKWGDNGFAWIDYANFPTL